MLSLCFAYAALPDPVKVTTSIMSLHLRPVRGLLSYLLPFLLPRTS